MCYIISIRRINHRVANMQKFHFKPCSHTTHDDENLLKFQNDSTARDGGFATRLDIICKKPK